jgi:hypothetical protein
MTTIEEAIAVLSSINAEQDYEKFRTEARTHSAKVYEDFASALPNCQTRSECLYALVDAVRDTVKLYYHAYHNFDEVMLLARQDCDLHIDDFVVMCSNRITNLEFSKSDVSSASV